jgi:hypothetical protein
VAVVANWKDGVSAWQPDDKETATIPLIFRTSLFGLPLQRVVRMVPFLLKR